MTLRELKKLANDQKIRYEVILMLLEQGKIEHAKVICEDADDHKLSVHLLYGERSII